VLRTRLLGGFALHWWTIQHWRSQHRPSTWVNTPMQALDCACWFSDGCLPAGDPPARHFLVVPRVVQPTRVADEDLSMVGNQPDTRVRPTAYLKLTPTHRGIRFSWYSQDLCQRKYVWASRYRKSNCPEWGLSVAGKCLRNENLSIAKNNSSDSWKQSLDWKTKFVQR